MFSEREESTPKRKKKKRGTFAKKNFQHTAVQYRRTSEAVSSQFCLLSHVVAVCVSCVSPPPLPQYS